MGRTASPAIPQLTAAIGRGEGYREAIRALACVGEAGDPRVVPVLIKLLDAGSPTAQEAAEALGRVGPPALPALVARLRSSKDEAQMTSIWALGSMGKPAVPVLISCLNDGDLPLRCWAAEALGGIGADAAAAIPQLSKLQADGDPWVRQTAAKAVREIQFPARWAESERRREAATAARKIQGAGSDPAPQP
jgi:HEAT repeat protein